MQWQNILTRELEDRITSISELKIRRHLEPGNSQKQLLVQIAQSMSDLRQVLTAQLNEMKGIGSPATSMDFEGKVPLQVVNVRESSYQSKASLQHEEVRTLSDFQGKFETLSLQWERTQREHRHTTQMLRDLRMEIDSIANNSKKMFSAFDQIQKNIHKLSHIKPLIENIQKLLERRKNQWSTEPGYLSSIYQRPEQGEVLQQLVDQALLPLVERMHQPHHTFDCSM
ncbi:uncharacterized protein LOC134354331 [Mobula hypostoma]|uniref:uncharacterized protein LOC134354331 n=1 Tax=Mobula hypostoma TaxID=723540 RepID=UPI002FC3AC3D